MIEFKDNHRVELGLSPKCRFCKEEHHWKASSIPPERLYSTDALGWNKG